MSWLLSLLLRQKYLILTVKRGKVYFISVCFTRYSERGSYSGAGGVAGGGRMVEGEAGGRQEGREGANSCAVYLFLLVRFGYKPNGCRHPHPGLGFPLPTPRTVLANQCTNPLNTPLIHTQHTLEAANSNKGPL